MNMPYCCGDSSGMADWLQRSMVRSGRAQSGRTEADVMETITNGKNAVLFGPKAPASMAGMMARANHYSLARQHLCGATRKTMVDKQLDGANVMFSPANHTDIYKRVSKHA